METVEGEEPEPGEAVGEVGPTAVTVEGAAEGEESSGGVAPSADVHMTEAERPEVPVQEEAGAKEK